MRSFDVPIEPGRSPDRLLVMLPGVMDTPDIFFEHGFLQELRSAGVVADVQFVETRFGHYAQRKIVERLRIDVLEPARAAGYREIWLVGVSIGGFGALYAAKEHPELVDGLVVLSPFLGHMATKCGIRRAGGLRAWKPPKRPDFSAELWQWLQGYTRPDVQRPPLLLAYGAHENETYWGYSLLADVLPRERVFTYEGRHGWKTWRPMWPSIVQQVWGGETAGTRELGAIASRL